jgi:voltage-gated potassium channel
MSQQRDEKATGSEQAGNSAHYSLRARLHEIVFEADTPSGFWFDVVLIVSIVISVVVVMLDSVAQLNQRFGSLFFALEWTFTLLFTAEYLLRLWIIERSSKYAFSFFGIVDLLSVLPSYLSLFLPGGHYLLAIRTLRTLRIFRILKLAHYLVALDTLRKALIASMRKITVFLTSVLSLVVIMGSIMYLVESEASGFTSIPRSIYWAIVTITTVGYGDIHPETGLGQVIASIVMITGYAIIAVPTGIMTVEIARATKHEVTTQSCPSCSREGHDKDARFCKFCGAGLNPHH